MYQPLIWPFHLSDDPGCLRTAFHTERRKRLTNSLVYRVRRDVQLGRYFLGRKMLVDQEQAIELAGGKLPNPGGHHVRGGPVMKITRRVRHAIRTFQSNPHPAQHAVYSRAESTPPLGHLLKLGQ